METIVEQRTSPLTIFYENLDARYKQSVALAEKYSGDSTVENSETAATEKTDSVTISADAKNCLKSEETAPIIPSDEIATTDRAVEELSFTAVWSGVAKDGSTVQIDVAKSPDGAEYCAGKVTLTDTKGETRTETLSRSAVIHLNDNGEWNIQYPEVSDSGQPRLQGSAGDDIIIALPNGQSEFMAIDAGDGDNVIIDFTSGHTQIRTGKGDDTILGVGGGSYDVISGEGNDEIYLEGDYAKVEAGDGSDKVTAKNAISVELDGGHGDDAIVIDGKTLYKSEISGGQGNDSIQTTSFIAASSISGGDGNDNIAVDTSKNSSKFGYMRDVTISGDNGDDDISISSWAPFSGTIDGSVGNDSIRADNIGEATIIGGDADDHINIGRIFGQAQVAGSDGNDTIDVGSVFAESTISGDEGDDAIKVKYLGARQTASRSNKDSSVEAGWKYAQVAGGAGNDAIEVDTLGRTMLGGGKINGGTGDDAISVHNAEGNRTNPEIIAGGDGSDTITVTGTLRNGQINGGEGDDAITVENMIQADILGDDTVNEAKDKDASAAAPGGNDKITVGRMEFSSIDGGGGDDAITVESAIASGIAGGGGDDSVDITESIASDVFGEALKWDRQAALRQYTQYMKTQNSQKSTETSGGQNGTEDRGQSVEPSDQSAPKSQMSERELFLDALMRGDKSHPRVREILEGEKSLNTVA